MTEHLIHRRSISGSDGARSGHQRFALLRGVLVEDENCKDVAEQKARRDQSDPTEDIKTARTHPFERAFEIWRQTSRKTASGIRGREAGTVRDRSGNRWH